MVYYFTSNVVDPPAFVYVGKDKFENEELIRHGWDEDFHVDKLSSAHIYLRLTEGMTWTAIPEDLLKDLAQLTKANSIEGNKKENITIIYTPWSNLKKDGSMAAGQVSFKDHKLVKRTLVSARENPIINRLNKTRVEKHPDLMQEKEDHLKEVRKAERIAQQEQKKLEQQKATEYEKLRWDKEHGYDDMFAEENMGQSSNQDRDEDFLDDFM